MLRDMSDGQQVNGNYISVIEFSCMCIVVCMAAGACMCLMRYMRNDDDEECATAITRRPHLICTRWVNDGHCG